MFDDQNQIISDESGEGIKIQKPFIYTSAAFEGQTRVQIDEINRFRGIDGSAEITGDDLAFRVTNAAQIIEFL